MEKVQRITRGADGAYYGFVTCHHGGNEKATVHEIRFSQEWKRFFEENEFLVMKLPPNRKDGLKYKLVMNVTQGDGTTVQISVAEKIKGPASTFWYKDKNGLNMHPDNIKPVNPGHKRKAAIHTRVFTDPKTGTVFGMVGRALAMHEFGEGANRDSFFQTSLKPEDKKNCDSGFTLMRIRGTESEGSRSHYYLGKGPSRVHIEELRDHISFHPAAGPVEEDTVAQIEKKIAKTKQVEKSFDEEIRDFERITDEHNEEARSADEETLALKEFAEKIRKEVLPGEDREEEYLEGFFAYFRSPVGLGLNLPANPHPYASKESRLWGDGWTRANSEEVKWICSRPAKEVEKYHCFHCNGTLFNRGAHKSTCPFARRRSTKRTCVEQGKVPNPKREKERVNGND